MFVRMIRCEPQNILLPNLVMMTQHHEPESCGHFSSCCYLLGQDHGKGLYDQNMTVDSLATKFGLMIHHHKPGCLVKTNWITAFRVKATVKGQNLMFVQMISSKPSNILFSNLV